MHPSHTVTITHGSKPSHKDRIHLVGSAAGAVFDAVPPDVREAATALAKTRKFSARCGETMVLALDDTQWVFVGLGKVAQLGRSDFAQALAAGLSDARRAGLRKVSLQLPATLPWGVAEAARDPATALL